MENSEKSVGGRRKAGEKRPVRSFKSLATQVASSERSRQTTRERTRQGELATNS